MRYQKLGETELNVSVVGFGGWAIGGVPWGDANDEAALSALKFALDSGITFFDTAPIYGYGHSEELMGKVFTGATRHEVIIATKAGITWQENNPNSIMRNAKSESIIHEVEQSLKRLKTDYIDLLQIHWPDYETPLTETAKAMEHLIKQGKIRFGGCCNFPYDMLRFASQSGGFKTLQTRYNILEREAEHQLLPYCLDKNIGLIAYEPLARGLLTGKFAVDSTFAPNDLRSADKRFQGKRFINNLKLVEELKPLSKKLDCTPAQLAVAWALKHPAVTTAICGAKTKDHIAETVKAGELFIDNNTEENIANLISWFVDSRKLAIRFLSEQNKVDSSLEKKEDTK